MWKVGLTGGIGAGKSTVAKVFKLLNVPVIEADKVAKNILNNDPVIRNKVINIFGNNAYDENNKYNSKFVAEKVFNDSTLLLELNKLVHPVVKVEIKNWFEAQSSFPYAIEEAAVIEKSLDIDFIIYVQSSENIRIERTLKRDKFRTKEDVMLILEKQKSESSYNELADFVIENDEKKLVIPQVLDLDKKLRSSF